MNDDLGAHDEREKGVLATGDIFSVPRCASPELVFKSGKICRRIRSATPHLDTINYAPQH
ncbi:MAG: hypothetical protein JOY76_06055 [Hyphomicrobiales bacterium]|nr:hypothetical protein [Hyphomicrobiales bacterium]MBV8427304.1 hypothetical protein [Hyphomicrobiales bacterium]